MMEQGIQATFPEARLRAAGCHYFALLKYLELKHGLSFSNDSIISIFKEALEKQYMGTPGSGRIYISNALTDCNVLDAPKLLNMILSKPEYIRDYTYTRYIRDLKDRPKQDICIVRLVRPNGTHFLCDNKGETFDPMPPDRPAAKTWNFDSYRILE